MTIVATGYGIGNPTIGPVVFGYTLKFGATPPVVTQILNSSIENWYVVDYRIKRRRPLTEFEWRLLREYVQIRDRAARKANKAAELDERLRAKLARQHVTLETYTPRMYPGNWSGLQPIKRVIGNPNTRRTKVDSYGRRPGARAADPTGVSAGVRGRSGRGEDLRAPGQGVRERPGARGRNRRNPQERLSSRRAQRD